MCYVNGNFSLLAIVYMYVLYSITDFSIPNCYTYARGEIAPSPSTILIQEESIIRIRAGASRGVGPKVQSSYLHKVRRVRPSCYLLLLLTYFRSVLCCWSEKMGVLSLTCLSVTFVCVCRCSHQKQ